MSKRFLVAALLAGTGICLFCLSLITGASRGEAQGPPALTQHLDIKVENMSFTIRYPNGWSAAQDANVYKLLHVPIEEQDTLDAAALDKIAQIMIFTERRSDHAEAVRRLKEIEAETDSPSTFLTIGGWPALQRRQLAPKPQPGQRPLVGEPREMVLVITTAIAADRLLVRLEGRLRPDAPREIAGQIGAIGRSLVFITSGNPDQIKQEIEELSNKPALRSLVPSSVPETQSASKGAEPSEESAGAPVRVTRTGGTSSELEIAVSTDGQNIVIGSNQNTSVTPPVSYYFSTNGGQTFQPSAGISGNDPSVAFGPSGTFYAANLSSPDGIVNDIPISVSTPPSNGAAFAVRANAFTCPTTGKNVCPGGAADQEHIAADRLNTASGGDQVYSAWRQLDDRYGIVCSSDSGTTWSMPNFTAGDFPRITVGQDGFVYVVYAISDAEIMLNKYKSCQNNPAMLPEAGFPTLVTDKTKAVQCPIPGIDRCGGRNVLTGPMVAVDDKSARHIYVTYAVNTEFDKNTSLGNDNVVVQDSTDGGENWKPERRVTLSGNTKGRRFMPWVCAVDGTAHVSWYDRRAATAANNDLTDYFRGSAFLDDQRNLVPGMDFQVNAPGTADPQCASGWPEGMFNPPFDSESCSPQLQPQLAGRCSGSQNPCDFSDCGGVGMGVGASCQCNVAMNEVCNNNGGGQPKYGDYNGNACAAGRLYLAWASDTPLALGGIDIFFAVEPPFSSDVSITKTASPDPVTTGNELTYTVTVTNNGPDIANTVTVTDDLPAETTFVSCFSTGGGDCGGSANNQTVTFPSLASGESETITFVATVNCSVADGTVISNTATVSSVTPDPNPSNKSATVTTTASNPPPMIAGAAVDPSVLWPPNHKLVNVTVNYNVTDNCPLPPNSCTLSVTSNEPINGTGDGNTSPDWIILDAHHVHLRAERAGKGNGRIYTITITCIDSAGHSSSSRSVTVSVPHDRGRH